MRFKLFVKINSVLIVFTLRNYDFVYDLVIYVVKLYLAPMYYLILSLCLLHVKILNYCLYSEYYVMFVINRFFNITFYIR